MAEITVKTISAKDDLKKLLLGQEYDHQRPVKKIFLKARTSNVHIEKVRGCGGCFFKVNW
ncbi:hypothetical protein JG559_11945 [Enterococcus faecalis]|uniref:Uncharacterized protein n=1 Tax=Enterococcus faecalis TaxID=1351 RepID=A0A974NZ47_ENTFL|nr:hypothetical protein JG559_11945 [Enterococcus faecalis]